RARFRAARDRGHRARAERGWGSLPPREQGTRGAAAHRRHDQERRDRPHRQHYRGQAGHSRVELDPPRGRAPPRHLLHDARGWACDLRGARSPRRGRGEPPAGSARRGRDGMKRTPMTVRGAEALRAELKRLKSEARPHVIKAIAEARGHGDLSENAEYHAAREQQGFIEGRIKDIEHKLAQAQVIEPAKLPNTGKVVFGALVELEDQADGARVVYQVVGEDEADAVHERAAGAPRELGEELIARRAITSRSLYLDELVIAEGARGLRGDRFRQSRAAEAHHGLQGVGETAQVPALTLGELVLGGACCGRSARRGAAGCGTRLLHRPIVGGWNLPLSGAN